MKKFKQYRQGDVLIEEVSEVPGDLENVELDNGRIVLAYGESTGHAHAIQNKNVFYLKVKNQDKFFLLVKKECELNHQRHPKIDLPIGSYEVIKQVEHIRGEIRYVAD